MSKQTAVEWLQEQLKKGVDFNPLDKNSYLDNVEKLFEQAKAMEKEQIIAACDDWCSIDEYDNNDFKKYYNKKYGGEQ